MSGHRLCFPQLPVRSPEFEILIDISRHPLHLQNHHLAIMAPTHFKFTTPEGVNRRLSFSETPTWSLLASKLHALYGISLDNVGVSYVDNDGDEITLSSDEELQDFYKMSHQAGQVIKFAVVDLHASQSNPGKPRSFNRNPFDADPFEFIGEWENFPAVLVEDMSKSGPHAFVEVLSSNNSVAHDHIHQVDADTDTDDDRSTVQPPLSNKGKGRSLSFGAASITSVLEEEMSPKHPIHVYDLNSRKDDKVKDKDNSFDDPPAHIHVAAQSTPKVQAKIIDDSGDTDGTISPPKAVEVEDPPLPSLDESPASATSPSLIQDITSLVHDAAQIVSSHPELSEGLRNIGRNISSGTYWTAHREALSDIVNGASNLPSTEERRQVDEAAVMRLTSLVGNFFRTLSQVSVGTEDTRAPDINENRSDNQSRGESSAHVSPPWRGFQGMHTLGQHAAGSGPHIPPIFPSHTFHGMPPGHFRPPPFPFIHPGPPPPLPPHAPASPPPTQHPTSNTHDHQAADPSSGLGHISPPLPNVPSSPTPIPGSYEPSDNNRRESYQGFSPVSGDQSRSQPSKASAQDLFARVEAAKRLYKAEKQCYRQEREQRRREKLDGKASMRYSAMYVQGFFK